MIIELVALQLWKTPEIPIINTNNIFIYITNKVFFLNMILGWIQLLFFMADFRNAFVTTDTYTKCIVKIRYLLLTLNINLIL